VTFWQAYRTVALDALRAGLAGVAVGVPLAAAWYLVWSGRSAAAGALAIVVVLVGLAISARSLQRRS
jgi:hypothetical protein